MNEYICTLWQTYAWNTVYGQYVLTVIIYSLIYVFNIYL